MDEEEEEDVSEGSEPAEESVKEKSKKRGKSEKKSKKESGKKDKKEKKEKREKKSKKDKDAEPGGEGSIIEDEGDENARRSALFEQQVMEYENKLETMANEIEKFEKDNAELMEKNTELLKQTAEGNQNARLIASLETKYRLAAMEAKTAQEKNAFLEKTLEETKLVYEEEYDALEGEKANAMAHINELTEKINELESSNTRDRLEEALSDVAEFALHLDLLRRSEEVHNKEAFDVQQRLAAGMRVCVCMSGCECLCLGVSTNKILCLN